MNLLAIKFLFLIWTLHGGSCMDGDDENYVFPKHPAQREEFEKMLQIASGIMKKGILELILNNVKEATHKMNKYIRYVRLIGPGSLVQHNNHEFYSKDGWDDFNSRTAEGKARIMSILHIRAIFQVALLIEIVEHFNQVQEGRVKIKASIEDVHLDQNEMKYYKVKGIEPILQEMPLYKVWAEKMDKSKSKQKNSKKESKVLLRGSSSRSDAKFIFRKEQASSVNSEDNIWPSEEWVKWLNNETNNLNTIPKIFGKKVNHDEVTLIMMFDCQYPMVKEILNAYLKEGKVKFVLIGAKFEDTSYFYGETDEKLVQIINKKITYITFPEMDDYLKDIFRHGTNIYFGKTGN
uniref:ANF_receptor domain-containing protein n=1 Tax=Meloidogyne hapla TaxID=6305 RepID=A0A1I8B3X9_MELHA